MKRIMQCVTGNFAVAGLSRIVYTWGEYLNKNGIIFDYLCRQPDRDNSYVDRIEASGGKVSWPERGDGYFRKQKRMLHSYRYEVVHVHADTSYNLIKGAVLPKMLGVKKIIVHSHSSGLDKPGSVKGMLKFFMKTSVHFLCRPFISLFANEFCSCSDEATKWMYLGNARRNAKIIQNFIDVEDYIYDEAVRDSVRAENGLKDKIVVGHVGRFVYQKNQDFIVRIAKSIGQINKEVVFVLIGDGEDFERIRQNVAGEDNIKLLGWRNDVSKWMQAFDIFILPSHFEGLPIVGIEAQASGVTCLFSSEIDKMSKINDAVYFLDLDEKLWIDSIVNGVCIDDRRKESLLTQESDYNIVNGIKQLKALYSVA